MHRFYSDRDAYGPEFDDRLILLVKENSAIYDVNHPHYRRNPVRVAIWERIASELGAPSKFLQTKWKNIRYNYLQEIKCFETGQTNPNLRKRRFTEDLSFLLNTAQTYNVKKSLLLKNTSSYNGSDNDSNSYMYPDPEEGATAYEVIEIDHSDDGSNQDFDFNGTGNSNITDDKFEGNTLFEPDLESTPLVAKKVTSNEPEPDVTIEPKRLRSSSRHISGIETKKSQQDTSYIDSNPSSPLLTPMSTSVMGNGTQLESKNDHIPTANGEITIEPIQKPDQAHNTRLPAAEIMSNATKRKSMAAPFPVLTPINDPIELYCLSLVDSLRNMPRSERERVKFEFAKILKDAEYKDQS